MNSLKKGGGVPLLNVEEGPEVPLLDFEGGPGVPLLNIRGVLGPTFKLWVGSRGHGPTFTPCRSTTSFMLQVYYETLLHQSLFNKVADIKRVHHKCFLMECFF